MTGSVEFATIGGSPNIVNTSWTTAFTAFSGYLRVKAVSLGGKYGVLTTVNNGNLFIMIDETGALGAPSGQVIAYDGSTTRISNSVADTGVWLDICWRPNAGNVDYYYKLASDSTWNTVVSQNLSSYTPNGIGIGNWLVSTSESTGTFRLGKVVYWDAAKSVAEIQGEAASRSLVTSTNAWFYNDCTAAASITTDASGAGHNFTLTGTPTDVADDPGFPVSVVQYAYVGGQNGGTNSVTLTGVQTAGNANIIAIWKVSGSSTTASAVTSVTDLAGNTYTFQEFASSSGGGYSAGVWIYTCTNIAAYTAPLGVGNTVTALFTAGDYFDMAVVETTPTTGIRTSNAAQYSGGPTNLEVDLTNTQSNDFVFVAGSYNVTDAAPTVTVGANTALTTQINPAFEEPFMAWALSDGSSPLACVLAQSNLDWVMSAIVLSPASGTSGTINVVGIRYVTS